METIESGTKAIKGAEGIIDLDGALARVMEDMELLCEIIEIFNEECPGQLREIRDAIKNGDASLLRNSAHTIKGSIANFCAKRAFDLALKLEIMGREGNLTGAEEAFSDLVSAVEELKGTLETIKNAS